MQCPECKTNTSSIMRYCEHCNHDLEEFKSRMNTRFDKTEYYSDGSSKSEFRAKIGLPVIIASIIWFAAALIFTLNFILPAILFGAALLIVYYKPSEGRHYSNHDSSDGFDFDSDYNYGDDCAHGIDCDCSDDFD